MKYDVFETDQIIETGVGELFRGLWRLQENGQYQEAYDSMGAVLRMLQESRQHLRKTQNIDI